jgi:hypothetical protein
LFVLLERRKKLKIKRQNNLAIAKLKEHEETFMGTDTIEAIYDQADQGISVEESSKTS